MKKLTLITSLIFIYSLYNQNIIGQVKEFNRISLDGSIGVNKAIAPKGYSEPYFNLLHGNLGVRYMANSKFGVKFEASIDRFIGSSGTLESKGRLLKGSLQAVANLGRIANFEDWTKRISLLAHAGPAIGFLKDISSYPVNGIDKIGGLVLGITPQFLLTPKLAMTADLSVIGTFRQAHTYDYRPYKGVAGFDGYHGTASIGLSYYLGKKATHVDWKFEDDAAMKKRLDELEAELVNTKQDLDLLKQDTKAIDSKMMDDDNDGVANYLDIEPTTTEGAVVNTKGQEIKTPKFDDLMNSDSDQGLFYTVQLGVFISVIPEKYWQGISPMYKLKIEDGTTRYYSGIFHSVIEAKVKLEKARQNGLIDAFITAYYRGQRITVAEADLILLAKGAASLRAKP